MPTIRPWDIPDDQVLCLEVLTANAIFELVGLTFLPTMRAPGAHVAKTLGTLGRGITELVFWDTAFPTIVLSSCGAHENSSSGTVRGDKTFHV